MKALRQIHRSSATHMVGDGFPVRSVFGYNDLGQKLSPFLLLDYAEPHEFAPSDKPRGVESHPHRGFETVTVVYQGEVEHRDSSGGGGLIGPGDVQWMTAASGLVHEEMHSREFTRRGGTLEMVQLWVNLPAKEKSAPPGYQTLLAADIPNASLTNNGGTVRVIAGELFGKKGAARTFTPINLWDIQRRAGHAVELPLPDATTTALLVLRGQVTLTDGQIANAGELAIFDRAGLGLAINAVADSTLLLLNGEPIPEPIVGHGPFVMNTREEIACAFEDFQQGRMGTLPPK